jgi:hypothetical protein
VSVAVPSFGTAEEKTLFAVCCLEIRAQTDHGLRAWENVQKQKHLGDMFVGAHSMLSSAANISMLFAPWSSAGNYAKRRGAMLTSAFGALASLPNIVSRAARNSLEHFDERINEWVQFSFASGAPMLWVDLNVALTADVKTDSTTARNLNATPFKVITVLHSEEVSRWQYDDVQCGQLHNLS